MPRRPRPEEFDGSDGDEDLLEEDELDEDDVEEDGTEDDDDAEDSESGHVVPTQEFARGRKRPSAGVPYSSYASGAIKRLTLDNFMVYRRTCAHFGPQMNMILGPNGAGKSSLLNAICLVLGGKPSVLGRQKHIKDFVRLGQERAMIEIELHPNTIIRREIHSGGASKWWVNGKLTSEKALKDLTRAHHLQVDNLCQFLPQDRVSDFSGMNMYELLENTLKAIGDEQLSGDYETLKELGQTVQKGRFDLERVTAKVLALSNEKARLEKEVVAFREMAQLRKEVGLLRVKRLLLITRNKDDIVKAIGGEAKVIQNVIKELEQKVRPTTDRIKELKKKLEDLKKQVQRHDQTSSVIEARISKVKDKAGDAMDSYAELYSDWLSSKETLKSQEETVAKVKVAVDELKKLLDDAVDSLPRPLNEMKKELQNLARAHDNIRRSANELMSRKAELESSISALDVRIRNETTRLNNIQSTQSKKVVKLRELNEDAYKALMVLREGSMQFRGQVYEPPFVSLEIPNPEHRKVVETYVPMRDLSAFYFEFTSDQNSFAAEMRNKRGLRVNCIHASLDDDDRRRGPLKASPVTDEMRRSGISCFVSDTFEAPQILKDVLCRDHMLHKIPVGNETTYNQATALCENYGFQRLFVAFNKRAYNIQCVRSKYSGAMNTSFNPCVPRNIFDFGQDNRELEAALKNSIQKSQDERDRLAQALQELTPQVGSRSEEACESSKKCSEIEGQLTKITSLERGYGAKIGEQRRAEDRLEDLQRRGCDSYSRSEEVLKSFFEAQLPLKKLVDDLVQVMRARFQVDFQHKKVMRSIAQAEEEITSVTQDKRQKTEELDVVFKRLNEAKAERKDAVEEQQKLKEKLEREFEEPIQYDDLSNLPDTIDAVDNELGVKEPRLRVATTDVTRASVNEYEKVSAELSVNEQQKTRLEAAYAGAGEKFDSVLGRWRPRAEAVIGKINQRFMEFIESIGCAGQVSLKIPDDPAKVEKYGAEILVKFRLNEPLSPLSSTRHSGGERSVCTMIYMMSMQELTKVPFRCVDEINQGMDETNEKRVFEVLTALAKTSSAQYVLLTPKLIPGLQVARSVTVLTLMRYVRSDEFCFQKFLHKFTLDAQEDNRKCNFCALASAKPTGDLQTSLPIPSKEQRDYYVFSHCPFPITV